MQKMVRLDQEFTALQQGALSHADFRALWEDKLLDMIDAEMDMPTEQTLFRNYLCKLNPEIRARVMSKDWKIDGEGRPARTPTTHEEVARAVSLLLEERADIHATGNAGNDGVMTLDQAPGKKDEWSFWKACPGYDSASAPAQDSGKNYNTPPAGWYGRCKEGAK